jgi:hypothetical protein
MTGRHATSTKDYTSKEDDEHGSNQNDAFVAHDSFLNEQQSKTIGNMWYQRFSYLQREDFQPLLLYG